MPYSHLDPRNPRNPDQEIQEFLPIPGELQVRAPPGSVLMQDSRTWHSGAANVADATRLSVVVRWAPWWLSLEWGDPAKGAYANANAGVIPRAVYDHWSAETQLLFRHRAEGVRDQLQYPLQLMSAKVDNMRQSRREEMERARERGEEPAGNEGVVVQPYRLPKL